MSKADTASLIEMLMWRRPGGSRTERNFIRRFIDPLGVERDKRGNLVKRIGSAPVMWSCHTDTVHRAGGFQNVRLASGKIGLSAGSQSNCLGADDTAGIWLMTEMIKAERPGLYVFHREEECGGLGSKYIAKQRAELLKDIQYAIALDRRGNDSVITFQWSGRCCSETFAKELGARIGHGYKADPGGSFTDTANYMKLIPECTNLSVGYQGEHSSGETLDSDHVMRLRDSLLGLDMTDMPVERDPNVYESRWAGYNYSDGYWDRRHGYSVWHPNKGSAVSTKTAWCRTCLRHSSWCQCTTMECGHEEDDLACNAARDPTKPDIRETIKRNPEEIIKIMSDYGMSEDEIIEAIYEKGGALHY